MSRLPILSKRLSAALPFIKKGDVVADIGTDHAYLPIHLVLSGLCKYAYACDINEGPCMRAKENARHYGVSDAVRVSKRDGICGLEESEVNKFILFGMGGELIASILSAVPIREGTEFILGPMTKQDALRSYLSENGFSILDEDVVADGGKTYQIILARKGGEAYSLSPAELKLGRINIEKRTPLFIEYVKKCESDLLRAQAGRRAAGIASEDDALLEEIQNKILKNT